ncbi:GRIP and coiled-coil domain-containing protein 2 [Colossoma macropomum]|uniref:GRIP and coiled-coil domain-containing protein 2 n=1 Tax=Colossoma macropomum TaxID=42526 RepID=UPI001863E2EE|nr:GRIP and coiled-coil domain-containing protein 2 [Colossoma macropomum]
MERDSDMEGVSPSPGLGKSKLDTLSKDDLIKFAKKQMAVMQKLKSKCSDLEKEVGALKTRPSESSDNSVIQELTERMDAVLLEKAETQQTLVLLRKENEKVKKQAEEALESVSALQEKLDHVNKEHIEKMKVMENNFEASEAKYREELESFKKRESEQKESEETQRQRLMDEFNSSIEAVRQEYEKTISGLQLDLESAKKEGAAETEALTEAHKTVLQKSQEDLESLHEEITRLSKQHEAELRDLEEQLEENAAHFEMERERLLLVQEELSEQLAVKESFLQDVQEEEEDPNKNGAQKASGTMETVASSPLEEPENETDRLRLTLQDLQSQNTMLQEELTFLSNVKTELESELQHLKEEFTVEKEELEFKINELQMTKEDTCLEKDAPADNEQGAVSVDQHEQQLQALKELHQTEMKDLESRLNCSAEREQEAVMELKEWRFKCEVLSEEKNAVMGEYEHTKEILRNIEVELGEKTNDFVKQYNVMKEQAASSIQELQEQLTEKDRLIEELKSSLTSSQTVVSTNEDLPQPQLQQEESSAPEVSEDLLAVTSDEEKRATPEKTTVDTGNECKFGQTDTAQLSLQKLEDLSAALEGSLVERNRLTSCVADLEAQLSCTIAEKDQLAKRCCALEEDCAALQTTEEQTKAALRQLQTITEEKAELQKDLQSVSEDRDALRKDLETSKRRLLDAQACVSEVLLQSYSVTLGGDEEISVLLDQLLSRVQEEKTILTQQLNEQAAQLTEMRSQEQDGRLNEDTGSLQEDHTETETQSEEPSQGTEGVEVVEVVEGLVVKEHQPPDEAGAQQTDDMKSFQQKLSEKESIIAQLREEISHLQESRSSSLNENMRQMEILEKESKEKDERMNKIKAVAVKARKELEISKKEASELKEELEALKAEREKLSDSMKGIIHGAEDYKNLMIDYDKQTELLDKEKEKVDAAEKLNADLTKRLQAAVEQNKQLLSEREDLMARMETLQSNVRQLEAQTLELHKLKSGLERDLETERLLKEQKTKDHQAAVRESEELNSLLHKQKQQLQQTEQQLEQLRKDAQQSTLLDMEMADYERLVKELNQQLSEKDRQIEEQESRAEAQRDREDKLTQEMESLKSLADNAEEKASKIKQLLVKTKKDLADAKKEEVSQMIIQSSLKGELEASQQQLENYKIQCSELTADRHRLQEQLKSANDQHQKAFSSYQHQLTTLQNELSSKKAELESTLSEFEGYKVRVHNVLKQQKNRSSTQSDAEFSKQEREHMETTLEQLRSKLQESQLNLQSGTVELQQLHTEHDMLLERHNKMLQQTVAKEAELRERVLSLHSENVALRSEHSQSVSQLTAQADALRSSFREQMHHLQEEHRSTVETLQRQISSLEAQLFQLQKEPASAGSAPVQQSRKPQADRKLTELPLFDLQGIAREEGEGMETTETESISTAGTPPPTLEQLLTSPDPKQEPFVWQVEPSKEELTQKLNTASRSMEHLNSLLHESEATNAILMEQNNLLKSELRRLERNQEREKSVANLEYLKNVLLQFIFLRSGSEKQALLPVIHTMLQLSPEEKSKLAAIAQGEEEAAASRGSGWTSYLHSWSGIR